MKKAVWIDRSLVKSPYFIAICDTEIQFKSVLKKLKLPRKDYPEWIKEDNEGCAHTLVDGEGNLVCVVCIRKRLSRYEAIGMIIHEAVHVWQFIKKSLSEDAPSDEFEAYSIQNISQRLIEAYFKKS